MSLLMVSLYNQPWYKISMRIKMLSLAKISTPKRMINDPKSIASIEWIFPLYSMNVRANPQTHTNWYHFAKFLFFFFATTTTTLIRLWTKFRERKTGPAGNFPQIAQHTQHPSSRRGTIFRVARKLNNWSAGNEWGAQECTETVG